MCPLSHPCGREQASRIHMGCSWDFKVHAISRHLPTWERVAVCVCTKFTKARWPTTCALQRLVGFELCSDVPMCSYCLMFWMADSMDMKPCYDKQVLERHAAIWSTERQLLFSLQGWSKNCQRKQTSQLEEIQYKEIAASSLACLPQATNTAVVRLRSCSSHNDPRLPSPQTEKTRCLFSPWLCGLWHPASSHRLRSQRLREGWPEVAFWCQPSPHYYYILTLARFKISGRGPK